jgi:putative redox protein
MEVTAYWKGPYRCDIPVRACTVTTDEPPQYGGEDAGPMPTELFLASLAGCFAAAVAHAARKSEVELPDLTVTVRGEYEGLRFDRINVEVHSSHPRDELEGIVERAIDYCYVSNTLAKPPLLEYSLVDPPAKRSEQGVAQE